MTFLPHAQNLSINGGDFSEVNGNENHYYDHTNPLNMHGDNNSTTFVGGPYHNGPDNSITNEAVGNMNITGQGENCQVNMGSMDDMPSPPEESSKSSTQQHNTRTPVARSNASNHQRSNNGISNRAGGNLNVIGQGPGSRVQIGNNAHLAQQSMRTRNGLYSPTQEYGVEDRYSPQYLHPSQSQYGANFQHQMRSQHPKGWCDPPMEYFPQSPQQAAFSPIASPSPPPEYNCANSPSQMAGYPFNNHQYGHHRNVPYQPPAAAVNHQYMWDTPHSALPQTGYLSPTSTPPFHATSYPARNNQYMEYHNAVVAPAIVLSPAGIKDTPPSPLPVETVPLVQSNKSRREEQPPLAAPRPLVGRALTNILNPMPAAPSSAPPSANQALLSPVTQRVERQDALMPPSISPVSACTLVEELVPAKSEERGNGSINSDSNSPNANVTENTLLSASKIMSTSQEVLPEEANATSTEEITNDLPIPKSKPKAKKWRRLVNYIKRQVKKLGRRRSGAERFEQ